MSFLGLGWGHLFLGLCAGFGWDRVNFLHSSEYGAMVWICAENSVDNSGVVLLLLSSASTASKAFSASHPTPPVRSLGVHKKLGGDTAGTADPN